MEFWAKFFSANSSLATIQEISFRIEVKKDKEKTLNGTTDVQEFKIIKVLFISTVLKNN
ncbi:7110_t:CDS:2 [Gigaspora rosea]|nr:7110_t:CDS:2 [Gigaspora rosea]